MALDELDLVRAELDVLIGCRSVFALPADKAARYEELADREAELLRDRRRESSLRLLKA
jgi:hypothetical protein